MSPSPRRRRPAGATPGQVAAGSAQGTVMAQRLNGSAEPYPQRPGQVHTPDRSRIRHQEVAGGRPGGVSHATPDGRGRTALTGLHCRLAGQRLGRQGACPRVAAGAQVTARTRGRGLRRARALPAAGLGAETGCRRPRAAAAAVQRRRAAASMTATTAHWLRLKRSRCELAGGTAVRGGRTHAATHAGRSIRPAHCKARAYGSGWGSMLPPAGTAAVEDKPRLRRANAGPMTRVTVVNIHSCVGGKAG